MYRVLLITSLFFIGFSSLAQQTLSLVSVDTQTYSLWQRKDWDGLIEKGKEALSANIDFYYLRVRMGIAYYERKNYQMALHHFEKAYKLQSNEPYLKEYLYYSYLFAGREADARVFGETLPISMKKNLGIADEKYVDGLNLFYSYATNPNQSLGENYSIDVDLLKDGSQFISKSLGVFNLGLKHEVKPNFSIYHAYSNIQKKSFMYLQEDGVAYTDANNSSSLNQYYFSGNIRVAKGLNLSTGFHYINLRYPYEETVIGQGQPRIVTTTYSEHDFVGFASLTKSFRYITLGTTIYYSALNGAKQLQNDYLLSFYPMGNLNLYAVSTASLQREIFSNNSFDNRFVFHQLIGTKVFEFLWLEGFATYGDLHNFIQNNGSTVYNGTDLIKGIYGGRFIVFIKPQIKFTLNYNYQNLESYFASSQDYRKGINRIEYLNHSLTGGLTWNF